MGLPELGQTGLGATGCFGFQLEPFLVLEWIFILVSSWSLFWFPNGFGFLFWFPNGFLFLVSEWIFRFVTEWVFRRSELGQAVTSGLGSGWDGSP